jgi:2-phospho-L-lactate/phosphoenolpyruvate guanylyltransferase
VKSAGKKSRLSSILTEKEREEFGRLLLEEVLGTLRRAKLARETVVVSSDVEVLGSAMRWGALGVREDTDSGVNDAVTKGMAATSADEFLVLPSDLPLLTPSDMSDLLALRGAGLDVVISPSAAFDGTNALLFGRGSRLPLSYDRDSFWNHLASAGALGLSTGVCCKEGLMVDIDSPADFRLLADSSSSRPPVKFARKALRP